MLDLRFHKCPSAHIFGRFLTPDKFGMVIGFELGEQRPGRERIKLFQTQNIHIINAGRFARRDPVIFPPMRRLALCRDQSP